MSQITSFGGGGGLVTPVSVPNGGTGIASITDHALIVGSGVADVTVLAAATDGQIPIGSTGADPVIGNITSSGGTITITNGAGTINMEAVHTGDVDQLDGDSGSATPTLGVIDITGGNNITTAAGASAVAVSVSGTTQYALQVGSAAGALVSLGLGSANQVLHSNGAGANPTWSAVDLAADVTGTLPVANGGTGAATLTDHGVLVGSGTGAITPLTVGTDGQVIVGSTGADPVFATLASSDGSITYATGAGTLGLTVTQAGAAQLGGSTLATTAEVVTGTDSQKIVTCDGVAAKLGTQTDHGVLVGSGSTNAITALAVGATNQVLLGATGADPTWGTVPNAALTNSSITLSNGNNITITGSPVSLGGTATVNVSGTTQYAIQLGDATGSLDSLSLGSANQVLHSNGAGSNPSWGAVDLAVDVTGTLPVDNGGTGAASLTDHGVLVGSGTSAVTPLTVGTNGQVLLGSTGADPVFATLTSSGGTVTFTPGAGSLNLEAAGGGITWNEVTGTSQSMAVDQGYICNNAGLVTCTLPATAAFGSVFRVGGKGAGGWKIAQQAGQTITWDEASATTTGVGGSLASTDDYDAVELVCMTANTDFLVVSSKGNITVT